MRIDTVGDGIAWSCESLIQLGHAVQTAAGKKDKTLSTLERIANSLWQCKASRPEYQSVVLGQPFSVPERFPSLESRRTAVGTVLHRVVTAVKDEMRATYHASTASRPRGRSSDESFEWSLEESPFIVSVTEAINRIEEVAIAPAVEAAFRARSASHALSPKKLLHTKWTAVNPQEKEKHFVVTAVIEPELPGSPVVSVEIEAVYSKHARIIGWRELTDVAQWRRGWV
jgi:tryptophan-rich hypothetical protein